MSDAIEPVPSVSPTPAADGVAAASHALQPRRRRARGPARPHYLQGADVDHLLHLVVALMSEVSALRDRIDTHELLAGEGATPTPDAVERHVPAPAARALREQRRQAMLKRTLRVLTEPVETAGAYPAPASDTVDAMPADAGQAAFLDADADAAAAENLAPAGAVTPPSARSAG